MQKFKHILLGILALGLSQVVLAQDIDFEDTGTVVAINIGSNQITIDEQTFTLMNNVTIDAKPAILMLEEGDRVVYAGVKGSVRDELKDIFVEQSAKELKALEDYINSQNK